MHATPTRPRHVTPFFLTALGVGLIGWHAMAWRELPQYDAQQVETAVEGNLALDLARMGPHLQPDAAGVEKLRAQVRSEVEAQIGHERKQAQQGMVAGLICLLLAAGHLLFQRLAMKPQA